MVREITWQDVANALDTFIGRLLQRMYEEPQNGEYWQQELAVAMCKKQEAVMLAKQEKEQFKKTLFNITDNIIRKHQGQIK